jgi:hypothetical protein
MVNFQSSDHVTDQFTGSCAFPLESADSDRPLGPVLVSRQLGELTEVKPFSRSVFVNEFFKMFVHLFPPVLMQLVNDLIPAPLWPTKTKNPAQPVC